MTRDRTAIGLLLLLGVGVVYGRTVGFDFLDFDDEKYLRLHGHVRSGLSWENVHWAFTTAYFSNWHPVTWLSYYADHAISGFDPAVFHATNVFLHAAATLLLFAWLCASTGSTARSGVVAALFALHPLHVESVAWVSERKDVLSACFGFAALLAYTSYARRGGAARYIGVTLLFGLGLMSKSMLVTLPCVFLLLDFWPLRRTGSATVASTFGAEGPRSSGARLVGEKLPWLAMSAGTSWATWWAQSLGGATVPAEFIGLPARLANAVDSYSGYLLKAIWPTDLSIRYIHPQMAGGTPLTHLEVSLAMAGLLAVSALAWRWRSTGYAPVGWLWYLGMLVPAIGIVQVGNQAMADRYTYLPLVGVFIAGVWGTADLLAWAAPSRAVRRVLWVALASLIFAMSAKSWQQVGVWRSDTTLIRHGLSINPGDQVLHTALARELMLDGRIDAALRHYEMARRIAPSKPDVRFDLAEALAQHGDHQGAIREYTRCLELDSGHVKARKGLGRLRLYLGDVDGGIADLTAAVRSSPRDTRVRFWLASALILADRPGDAMIHLEETSRMLPRWARPLDEMAWLLATHPDSNVRDGARAVDLASRAVAVATGRKALAIATLAAARAELGDYEQAVHQAERALALAEAAGQTGWAEDIGEALPVYREGRPLRSKHPRRPPAADLTNPGGDTSTGSPGSSR